MPLSNAIRNEKDPEILVSLLEHCGHEIDRLNKRINEIEKANLKEQLNLDDKLCALNKQKFGKSSEKLENEEVIDRLRSDDVKTVHCESLAPAPKTEEIKKLKEITVETKLTKEELQDIAVEYGYPKESEWEELNGFYDESDFVDIKVESYVRKKVKRFKYRLKASKGSESEVIVTAPTALKIMPGSKYGIDFSVDVAVKKHLYHLPLERIKAIMKSGGLTIATNTLYSLTAFVSFYLESVAVRIKEEILTNGLCLHLDETPWPINNSKQDDGYMWVMSNAGGSFYQFEPTRSGKVAKEFLGSDYEGPILTDGYSGYKSQFKKSKSVKLCYCWAHVRRKFTDIQKNYPKETLQVLKLIKKLFKVEHKANNFEELKALRLKESAPIVEEIKTWLLKNKVKVRGESGLEKAINYAMNHWGGLTVFLKDERVPLTNNEAERSIRQSVMGRKNFYGSRSINGADVTTIFYTIVESCKKVELDPKHYILMAVKEKIKDKNKVVLTPLEYATKLRQNSVKTA